MKHNYKARRLVVSLIVAIVSISAVAYDMSRQQLQPIPNGVSKNARQEQAESSSAALSALAELPVKGRASKTGYERTQFSNGWAKYGDCDVRNIILRRDLKDIQLDDTCKVVSGTLADPYTGKQISFVRGATTSDEVQIDHVVALSNAWQTGAQQLSVERRHAFANDPLNLIAVDGKANQQKSDSDAATWLPSNKSFRCQYIARQIAVKQAYTLWLTPAEKSAMETALQRCPNQQMPVQ